MLDKRTCTAAAIFALFATEARANFKEQTLAVTPIYNLASVNGRNFHGGGAQVTYGFGITDSLTLQASAAVAGFGPPPDSSIPIAASVLFGLRYSFDILNLVPSASIDTGLLVFKAGTSSAYPGAIEKYAMGIGLGLALDYWLHRKVAVGIEFKYQLGVTDPNNFPAYFLVGPRVVFQLHE